MTTLKNKLTKEPSPIMYKVRHVLTIVLLVSFILALVGVIPIELSVFILIFSILLIVLLTIILFIRNKR